MSIRNKKQRGKNYPTVSILPKEQHPKKHYIDDRWATD